MKRSLWMVTCCLAATLALAAIGGHAARGQSSPADLPAKAEALKQVQSLFDQAIKLEQERKFDEALSIAEQLVVVAEKIEGPAGRTMIAPLTQLARLHGHKNNYARAAELYRHSLEIAERTLGGEHFVVVSNLVALASVYKNSGDYALAEPLYLRALAIEEKTRQPGAPPETINMEALADLYRLQADYRRAEEMFRRSLEIREQAGGTEHPDLTSPLNNLALIYTAVGDYTRARQHLQRTLDLRLKAYGPEHNFVALALNNLAQLDERQGNYVSALRLTERALPIIEKTLGTENQYYSTLLSNLASLHKELGDFDRAESLFRRTLATDEKLFGPEHPEVAHDLNNLAGLYHLKRDYERAVPLYQRAQAALEKTLGPEHPEVARALNNLAQGYGDQGDYARALPLLERALKIYEKTLGSQHPQTATTLNNLAGTYHTKGELPRALQLYERALHVWENSLGPQHHNVAMVLHNIALLYEAQGDIGQAIRFQTRAGDIRERNLELILTVGSEEQKLLYTARLAEEANSAVSLHLAGAPANGEAARLSLNTILRRKGRALDAMADQIGALRRRLNPEDQALLNQLATARSQLATLKLEGAGAASDPATREATITRLEREVEELENAISARSAEFRAQKQPVTIERVQAVIPTGAALVELTRYRPVKLQAFKLDPPRYAAYVLRHAGAPQWVDLGEAAPLEEAVAKWRSALSDPRRQDVKELAQALDARLMLPVRKLTGEARMLFISPDGALNLIPFGALVDERGSYLIENLSISYLSSGRDLLRLQTQATSRQGPILFANPQFDAGTSGTGNLSSPGGSSSPGGADSSPGRRSVDLSGTKFSQLPGTAAEAKALNTILPAPRVYTGAAATESALKQIAGPSILHIATHGFFLPAQAAAATTAQETRGLTLGGAPAQARGENPLLRSGLALAGANRRGSAGAAADDGILTAYEAASLDLWGTELVALSACETGVGEIRNGDGVHGLRRALVLAGSESQLMSLWQVSDEATRDLMVAYYKRLRAGEGRGEALRGVQIEFIKHGGESRAGGDQRGIGVILKPAAQDRRHPFYWASFIQSGEWKKLGNLFSERK